MNDNSCCCQNFIEKIVSIEERLRYLFSRLPILLVEAVSSNGGKEVEYAKGRYKFGREDNKCW